MNKILYKTNPVNGIYDLCFAYPADESFALSSLGYMWLYKTLDTIEDINCRRISTNNPNSPFKTTNAYAFSMSFDFDFQGVFEILSKNNIQLKSVDRGEDSPIIFAGGPVITTNPAPYNNIFDFMMIGDGEVLIKDVLDILKKSKSKLSALEKLAEVEGIYVPKISKNVKKITIPLTEVIYTPIISDNAYFKDTFVVELQRGCMNRCAFCTASYLNTPFRHYPYEEIIETIELGLKYTKKIALLGAQISAHPDFEKILSYIEAKMNGGDDIELGISSLRTDSVTQNLVKTLVKGGQKTSTIAIEAASERLRKLINKNLNESQILETVKICRENGLRGLKIYSMIGIPTENHEDICEFISLGEKLKKENKGFNIEFSFSSFVPKPNTPLQWSKREDTKSLEKKQKFLEKEFSKLGISAKFSSAKWDYWQTLLSRGDESLGDFMINVYHRGGKLSAFKQEVKVLSNKTLKAIEGFDFADVLPWDMVKNDINKDFLIKECKRLGIFN